MGISLQKVTYGVNSKSSKCRIEDVSVSINEKNEFITIVGMTGSGKTTLVQHMNALLYPTKGDVYIFGTKVVNKRSVKLKPLRKKVGLVFQFPEYQIFESTILDDVMFGPLNFGQDKKTSTELAKQALSLVGMKESMYDRTPFTLSGGELRRVAIAGILAIDPEILILDEPTVGLDPKGREEILTLLNDIHEKTSKTIVIITHNMDVVAKYAKRVLVMNCGKLVYDGNKQDLFDNKELIDKYQLDYPEISKIAIGLKEQGLIDFDKTPLVKQDLIDLLKEGIHE